MEHEHTTSYTYACVHESLPPPSTPPVKPPPLPAGYFKCSDALARAKCFAPMPVLPGPTNFSASATTLRTTEQSYHSCIQCAQQHGTRLVGCEVDYYPHICASSRQGMNISTWVICMNSIKQTCLSKASSPASCQQCAVENQNQFAQDNCTADVMGHACSGQPSMGPGVCKKLPSWQVQNSKNSLYAEKAQCEKMC